MLRAYSVRVVMADDSMMLLGEGHAGQLHCLKAQVPRLDRQFGMILRELLARDSSSEASSTSS